MNFSKESFLNAIRKGVNKTKSGYKTVKTSYKNAGDNAKNIGKDVKGALKSRKDLKNINRKALDKIMKIYPKNAGDLITEKRRGEFKKLLNQGKAKEAFSRARKLRAQFDKDNYNPDGTPIYYKK